MTQLRESGIKYIKEAQEFEANRQWAEALRCYELGIESLLASLKYEKTKSTVEIVRAKITSYLERAEDIKKIIAQSLAPKLVSNTPATTTADSELTSSVDAMVMKGSPGVTWDKIAGLAQVKETLKQSVVYPLTLTGVYSEGRVKPWAGILLYGAPGTGKTMLAKAVATEGKAKTFFNISVAGIMSKYVGESERMIKLVFERARQNSPSVIFIDEVDAIASHRTSNENDVSRKVKNQLLRDMDGVSEQKDQAAKVLVLAATNVPWDLDEAFMRRFQHRIYIPLPDAVTRKALVLSCLGAPEHHTLSDADVDWIVAQTQKWSGSDISTLVGIAQNAQLSMLPKVTHFKIVGAGKQTRMCPCAPDEHDALPVTVDEIVTEGKGDLVCLPPIRREDFELAFSQTNRTSSNESLRRLEEYISLRRA